MDRDMAGIKVSANVYGIRFLLVVLGAMASLCLWSSRYK